MHGYQHIWGDKLIFLCRGMYTCMCKLHLIIKSMDKNLNTLDCLWPLTGRPVPVRQSEPLGIRWLRLRGESNRPAGLSVVRQNFMSTKTPKFSCPICTAAGNRYWPTAIGRDDRYDSNDRTNYNIVNIVSRRERLLRSRLYNRFNTARHAPMSANRRSNCRERASRSIFCSTFF